MAKVEHVNDVITNVVKPTIIFNFFTCTTHRDNEDAKNTQPDDENLQKKVKQRARRRDENKEAWSKKKKNL